mgnify:CR=1 FL=1
MKVNNVKRKIKAVMNDIDEDDEDYIDLVNTYMESYVIGIELMEKLRTDQVDVYEQIIKLEQAYKREVSMKTKMNTDSSINYQLFTTILDDFSIGTGKRISLSDQSICGRTKKTIW